MSLSAIQCARCSRRVEWATMSYDADKDVRRLVVKCHGATEAMEIATSDLAPDPEFWKAVESGHAEAVAFKNTEYESIGTRFHGTTIVTGTFK